MYDRFARVARDAGDLPWTRFTRLGFALVFLLSGCGGEPVQSTLHPAGPAAADIAWLWWVMCGAFTAVFVLVLVLLVIAIFRSSGGSSPATAGSDSPSEAVERMSPPLGRTGFIVAGGVALPLAVLTPLFLASLHTSASQRPPQEALTVRVVGHMWWWEVRYPEHGIITANEIHIPVGRPVRLELTSADVIHSFWAPNLNGKRDMIPGLETVFEIQADAPGTYRGQCAEYCGVQHAKMAFLVIALPPDEFRAWLAERTAPGPEPDTEQQQRGLRVFTSAGCIQCHAMDGAPPQGRSKVGPDLTHLGSRRTIGAALLPNTRGNLAGWIADPQALKPGVKMPRTYLAADDLLALVDYLENRP
jgi:cytochrome c oxidase subunit 2